MALHACAAPLHRVLRGNKKKLLATLLVALTLVSTGCGASTSNSSSSGEPPTPKEESIPSRFSAEQVVIDSSCYLEIAYAYIITDSVTGKQYLYTWYKSGSGAGGASMVEIGTIDDTINK